MSKNLVGKLNNNGLIKRRKRWYLGVQQMELMETRESEVAKREQEVHFKELHHSLDLKAFSIKKELLETRIELAKETLQNKEDSTKLMIREAQLEQGQRELIIDTKTQKLDLIGMALELQKKELDNTRILMDSEKNLMEVSKQKADIETISQRIEVQRQGVENDRMLVEAQRLNNQTQIDRQAIEVGKKEIAVNKQSVINLQTLLEAQRLEAEAKQAISESDFAMEKTNFDMQKRETGLEFKAKELELQSNEIDSKISISKALEDISDRKHSQNLKDLRYEEREAQMRLFAKENSLDEKANRMEAERNEHNERLVDKQWSLYEKWLKMRQENKEALAIASYAKAEKKGENYEGYDPDPYYGGEGGYY